MELNIHNKNGEDAGRKVNLNDEVFAIQPNDHAIYLDVKQYLANQRQGTHKAKEKAEVSYSTKKIKRQKGTGTARAGSIKSPTFVGGGRVFGPRPRDYNFKLNKKVKKLARQSAFSYLVKENRLKIVEDFSTDTVKTKEFIQILKNLKLEKRKSLLIFPSVHENVRLSSRNIPYTNVISVNNISTYTLLNTDMVVLSESGIELIEKTLNN